MKKRREIKRGRIKVFDKNHLYVCRTASTTKRFLYFINVKARWSQILVSKYIQGWLLTPFLDEAWVSAVAVTISQLLFNLLILSHKSIMLNYSSSHVYIVMSFVPSHPPPFEIDLSWDRIFINAPSIFDLHHLCGMIHNKGRLNQIGLAKLLKGLKKEEQEDRKWEMSGMKCASPNWWLYNSK